MRKISADIYRHMYRQMRSLSADNGHIDRYIVQSADIVLSADDRMSADYLQYRIGRISLSANFPNLDIVCTLSCASCRGSCSLSGLCVFASRRHFLSNPEQRESLSTRGPRSERGRTEQPRDKLYKSRDQPTIDRKEGLRSQSTG